MSHACEIERRYPRLAKTLPRLPLANLPTPVSTMTLELATGPRSVVVKQDNRSAQPYGGNKVRKLEYLLARARRRKRRVIATFGTVGSHHALATAVYARRTDFGCVLFLSHQTHTDAVPASLNTLLELGAEMVPFGGRYAQRIATLRRYLRGRRAAVIPGGGSSWLGTVGFVNAGLELAAQVRDGDCPAPDRVYVATGTMGTAAGLALGLALAGLPCEVHAVRISPSYITSEEKLQRLIGKTAAMLNRLEPAVPADLGDSTRLRLRHEFFAGGYARTDAATEHAVRLARRDLNLHLEATYTGKAMAAMLSDLREPAAQNTTALFWQSYHGAPLPAGSGRPPDPAQLPPEFLRYYP